jgi:hypothetical protein
MNQVPAAPVGTPVHFVNAAQVCRAALITEVKQVDGLHDLHVFHPRELGDRLDIPFSAVGEPMSWHTFDPSVEPGCRAGVAMIDPR